MEVFIIGHIKILDTHTINKIAAGEVVERPSSVVKEVVENSIDAGASAITVEIKKGGIELIRVTDNGMGIPKDEVEVAFLRHATSKITSAEDLYEVISLGFRGEALASIAAVSNVELLTKVADDLTGSRLQISGGKMTPVEEIACPNGTTFIMRHLFFNVPARHAFLSSPGIEAAKISDYMYKLALAHPEIAFKYIQNGKTVFVTSGDHNLSHAVLNIYGKEYAKNSVNCYSNNQGIECVGLLGKPILNRGNRHYEHFFINGRYIKSQILQNAVEDAYKTLIMVGKFPFVILHLKMSPEEVDVNVHPTKLQVRFRDPDHIYNVVYKAVTNTLQETYLVPQVAPHQKGDIAPIEPEVEQISVDPFFTPRKEHNKPTAHTLLAGDMPLVQELPFETLNASDLLNAQVSENLKTTYNSQLEEKAIVERLFGPPKKSISSYSEVSILKASKEDVPPEGQGIEPYKMVSRDEVGVLKESRILPAAVAPYMKPPIEVVQESSSALSKMDYRIIGQLFKTYWMIEYHEKIFLIDQHSAHERVMYEKFMAKFRTHKVPTQLLLVPETLTLSSMEMEIVKNNEDLFKKLGFAFEIFGEKAIVIREVPYVLNDPMSPTVFKEVLDRLDAENLKDITDLKEENIIRMSCRSAVKAHDHMSDEECHELIEALLALDNPFTCPHGRPTLVALTKADIEKMFKRI